MMALRSTAARRPGIVRPLRRPLDPAGLLGVATALAVIGIAIVAGSAPRAFVDVPSLLIVFGGTCGVTLASFSLPEVARLPRVLASALSVHPPLSARRVALDVLEVADAARRDDPREFERRVDALGGLEVLQRGLRLALEGAPRDRIAQTLRREVAAALDREGGSIEILRRAADVAPAMGLIGTLIGLVQMLGQLDDPSAIGPAMAVALLTTLYGALLAHAVITPLAEKLARRSEAQAVSAELQCLAALSIADRDNPRKLEAALNGLMGPDERVQYFA